MPLKYIIDMDIGDDIDDAIALYAAMRRGLNLVGITTVFQNTPQRARQVKKLLKAYGRGYENVPVYAGHGTPLKKKPEAWPCIPHYTPDLEDALYDPDSTDPDDAVQFILDSCRRYGKELAVIAIGAFTNMARVIEKDPQALNRISKVLIMGGAYFKQYADWNVICDVEAADRMFRSVKHLECIGADVTHLMPAEERLYQNLLAYQGSEPGHLYLSQLCHLWRKDRPASPLLLHDPLVIYYAADPSICTMLPASVAVLTEGFARGLTLNVNAYGKRAHNPDAYADFDDGHQALVASAANREAFNQMIFRDFDI